MLEPDGHTKDGRPIYNITIDSELLNQALTWWAIRHPDKILYRWFREGYKELKEGGYPMTVSLVNAVEGGIPMIQGDKIYCPYCEHDNGTIHSWIGLHDKPGGIRECKNCGETFRYKADLSVLYRTFNRDEVIRGEDRWDGS